MNRSHIVAIGLSMALAMSPATASDWQDKLEQALDSSLRTEAEKARDGNRLPAETLEFMRFSDDLRVLEMFPGNGWYTKLLAPVLAEKGQLYLALSTGRVAGLAESVPELADVEILDVNPAMPSTDRRGIFNLEEFSFWLEDLDLVLDGRRFRRRCGYSPGGETGAPEQFF